MIRSAMRRAVSAALAAPLFLAYPASAAAPKADPSQKVLRTGACQILQLRELKVSMEDGRPTIESELEGRKVRMLVDTGVANNMLLMAQANRLGIGHGLLTIDDPITFTELIGVGVATDIHSTRIEDFKLDAIEAKGVTMLVAGNAPHLGAEDIAGAVGAATFSSLDVEFDLANGVIRFFLVRDCKDREMAYWGGPFSVAPLKSKPDAYYEFRMDATLNGKRVEAILASGLETTIVTAPAARRVGGRVDRQAGRVNIGGRFTKEGLPSWVGAFDSFTIGDESIIGALRLQIADPFAQDSTTPTGTRLLRRPSGTPELLLGADFFRSHRILISNSQGKVYFTPSGGPVFKTRASVDVGEPE